MRSLDDLLAFDRYFIVGANSGGDMVRAWLGARGKEVAGFTDLDPALCGTIREGIPVRSVRELCGRLDGRSAFAIGTVRQREAGLLLVDEFGVDPAQVLPFVNDMFAEHYKAGVQARLAPRFARVRELLADDDSRSHFDRVTSFYATLDPRRLARNPRCRGQYGYDAPGANAKPGAAVVDCGAYVGDTFDDFLKASDGDCRIYALEAFLPNLERLLANVAQRKLEAIVTPLHVAAGRATGPVTISGDAVIADGCAGVGAKDRGRRDIVLGETLDNLFLTHLPQRIDYLKIDIEGADLDALAGAERLLRSQRPVVAVAAYHKPEHMAEIAEFLHAALTPCRIYAGHDPSWIFHIHYIAVPDERA